MEDVIVSGRTISSGTQLVSERVLASKPFGRLRCDQVMLVTCRTYALSIDRDVRHVGAQAATDTMLDATIRVGGPQRCDGSRHSSDRTGCRLDLTRLGTNSTNLDLGVEPSQVDHAVGVEHPHTIARAIQRLPGRRDCWGGTLSQ